MVNVLVRKAGGSSASVPFEGVTTGAQLEQAVRKARQFGQGKLDGSLETEQGGVVGPDYILQQGATYTWYPSADDAKSGAGASVVTAVDVEGLSKALLEPMREAMAEAIATGVKLAVDQLAALEDYAISASGATEAQTIRVMKRLRIVFAGGCPCNRQAAHPYQNPSPRMNWVGTESSRRNMEAACKVLQHWVDDAELVVVAVPGTPWLTYTMPHLTLSGSKTDLVVLDIKLLDSLGLSTEEYNEAISYGPSARLLRKVLECIVLAYECKPLTTAKQMSNVKAHQWQCIIEYLAVNCIRAVQCGAEWSPEMEVEVYGGNCMPEATIGVHSIIMPDAAHPTLQPVHARASGLRHLHVEQPLPMLIPAMVRQSAQRVKEAMRRMKLGAGALPMELDAPVASTSGLGVQRAAGFLLHPQRLMGPLEAGAVSTQHPLAEAYSVSPSCSCALMGPESASSDDSPAFDVPEHYHEQAVFNAAWHELMEAQLNEPAIQQGLGGPTTRQAINSADPYSWAARLTRAAVEALQQQRTCWAQGGTSTFGQSSKWSDQHQAVWDGVGN